MTKKSAYFTHSKGSCVKRYMNDTTRENNIGYIDYYFILSGFRFGLEQHNSYRFFHIVFDNLEMSLRHNTALGGENVGKYFLITKKQRKQHLHFVMLITYMIGINITYNLSCSLLL